MKVSHTAHFASMFQGAVVGVALHRFGPKALPYFVPLKKYLFYFAVGTLLSLEYVYPYLMIHVFTNIGKTPSHSEMH